MSKAIYQRVAVTDTGDVIPGAEYTVVDENTGLDLTIYSDRNGAAKSPPYFADSNGVIQFFTDAGKTYRVSATGPTGTYTDRYVQGLLLQSSETDTTAGALMQVGAGGLLGKPEQLNTGGYDLLSGAPNQLIPVFDNAELPGTRTVIHMTNNTGTVQVDLAPRSNGIDFDWRGISDGTPTPWRSIYHTGNLLGTVSQSAGVPTGAVIERGRNANGEYVKFADGTMICTHLLSVSSLGSQWNFPATFSTTDSVTATADTSSFPVFANVSGLSSSSVNVRTITSNTGANVTGFANMSAIGRWF